MSALLDNISIGILLNLLYDIGKVGLAKLKSDNPTNPVLIAIRRTATKYCDIEDLEKTLETWIQNTSVQASLAAFREGRQDINIEDISRHLVRDAHFYMAEESEEKSIEIVRQFFVFLNEEYLASDKGLLFISQREDAHHTKISEGIDAVRDAVQDLSVAAQRGVTNINLRLASLQDGDLLKGKIKAHINKDIDRARDFLLKGKASTAKKLLEALLKEIQKDSEIPKELLFRVYTNLGCCELDLDEEVKTAEYFESAYNLLPEHATAIANMAIARKIRGKPEEGLTFLDGLLKSEPAFITGLCAKSSLLTDLNRLDEAIAVFKKKEENIFDDGLLKDPKCCYTIGYLFYRKRDFDNSVKFLERAISQDPDSADSLLLLALSIAVPILEEKTLPGLMLESQTQALLLAEKHLNRAYEIIKASESPSKISDVLVNRSSIRLALNKLDATIEDCDIAIGLNPNISLAHKNKGMALSLGAQYEAAEKSWLLALEKGESKQELVSLLAHLYLSKKPPEPDKGISLIDKHFPKPDIEGHNLYINLELVACYISKKDFNSALSLLERLLVQAPHDSRLHYEYFHYHKSQSNFERAEESLVAALKYGGGFDSLLMSLELANFYYERKLYDKAIPFYSKIINPNIDSPPLLRYLASLYYSSNKEANYPLCLSICKKYRLEHGPSRHITEIEALIQENLKNLSDASSLYKELIDIEPDNYSHRLRLGLVEFRRGNHSAALDILKDIIDKFEEDANALVPIAEVFDFLGKKREALELAYRALKAAPKDPRVYITYIHLFLSRDNSIDKKLDLRSIDVDTVVSLKLNNSEHSFTIVASAKKESLEAVPIDSDFGSCLRGHKVGDKIIFGTEEASQTTIEILEIKSIYVKAFQDCLIRFPVLFPEEEGLRVVNVGKKLKNILNILDKAAESAKTFADFYHKRRLTIGALSRLSHNDIFDTWLYLSNSPDAHLICSNGNPDEQLKERQCLDETKNVIIDLVSLFTLSDLGHLDIFPGLFEQVYISQSSLDEITQIIGLSKIYGDKGYSLVGKSGGDYIRRDIAPDEIHNKISFLDKLQTFIKQKLTITGISTPFSFSEERLCEVMGAPSVDTIRIAKEKDLAISSDDKIFRDLARNECQIKGFGIQAILNKALNDGIISRDAYNDSIIKLVMHHYSYVSIDGDLLLYSARKSAFSFSIESIELLRVLETQTTSLPSAGNVAAAFLKHLWLEPIGAGTKSAYLDLVLGALTKERNTRDVMKALVISLRKALFVLPIQLTEILRCMSDWNKRQIYLR